MFLEEHHHGLLISIAILAFPVPVAFVERVHIPDRLALSPQCSNHLFGLGYGGSFTMIQLVCVESFGRRALGKLLGIIICIDSAGGMLGTVWTGQMKTATGSYLFPFSIVSLVALFALLNVLLIKPVARN